LQSENAELKTKIPSFKDKLTYNQQEIKIKDLETKNSYLENLLNKILSALPEREREIAQRIINPSRQKRSQDIDLS
jgi:hypothetical protein